MEWAFQAPKAWAGKLEAGMEVREDDPDVGGGLEDDEG